MDRSRSCDRCYKLKEKCIFSESDESCNRCRRLRRDCTTLREVRRRGRRIKPDTPLLGVSKTLTWMHSETPQSGKHSALPRSRYMDGEVTSSITQQLISMDCFINYGSTATHMSEDQLTSLILDKELFLGRFLLGPSFAEDMRQQLMIHITQHSALTKEAYLACSGGFAKACRLAPSSDEFNLSRSATAVQKLRSVRIQHFDEIPIVLSLGAFIIFFDMTRNCSGVHSICRYALSVLEPWYASMWKSSDLDFYSICLIYHDTVECLIRRQLPIIKYKVRNKFHVDRYAGVCCSLIPIMYDVNQLGVSSRNWDIKSLTTEQLLQFHRLEAQVDEWQPTPPADFIEKFSNNEVVSILTQARVYRSAVSLLLHRLRYPFGEEDETAKQKSQAIMRELDLCASITGCYPLYSMMPFMLAAAEFTSTKDRKVFLNALHHGPRSVLIQYTDKLRRFIESVWSSRDEGYNELLFDLVDRSPPSFICMP